MTLPARSRGPSADFERRCARAEMLARGASDPEPLRFAAGLLRTQAGVAAALEAKHDEHPLTGRLANDMSRVLEELLDVPRFAARSAPLPLARVARSRAFEKAEVAEARLQVFWSGGRTSAEDYLSRAMLRPYLELLRAACRAPDRPSSRGACPFCGGGPAVGALRGGAEGQGAARSFQCALCGLEWGVHRVQCASCGERDPSKLPCFSSERHPAVRLEACETCRRYVKTFDLSRDARPLPEVDDLSSIALDLWAHEQGLSRIEPGLAGI